MSLQIESNEALDIPSRPNSKCTKRLKKCKGFDTTYTSYDPEMLKFICNDRRPPCCGLVLLYAKMGLHRYNLLQSLTVSLAAHKRTGHMTTVSAACSYYITLVATDPSRSKPLIFQTKVNEENYGKMILTCDIARRRGKIINDGTLNEYYCYLKSSLPECLPEDLFENRERFYVVKESELQQNDWIRLYLELTVAISHKNTGRDHDLSDLKILKVAIETTEDLGPPNEGSLNVLTALVYIRYEDPCESRVGKDSDRIAIFRRTFNEGKGCFILKGQNQVMKSEVAHGIQALRL